MSNNQILLSYPESDNEIKTICENSIVYFSLPDVVKTLASQNTKLSGGTKPNGLGGLIKAQLEVLESDEFINIENEPFVTEPGLFRIILRDNSEACKRFQRWVLHEVLPSIQKYGTYPAPIVEQNSDVKRIVQSLLMEIEEREKLEKRTKEQFKKHEMMLNDISQKLTSVTINQDTNNFSSIASYCKSNGIDDSHEHIIFGWCIKICAEENEPNIQKIIDGEKVLLFPEHVISKAHNYVLER